MPVCLENPTGCILSFPKIRKNSILISLDAASPTAITSSDEKLYLRKVL
jgi:hypothetical protein